MPVSSGRKKRIAMDPDQKHDFLVDIITGKMVPDIGAEANRQKVERLLVEIKRFRPEEVEVDAPIAFTVDGERYASRVDLVVSVSGKKGMVIKCAAGSLGSRERETVAAARLIDMHQVPFSVISDGRTALIIETHTARKIGEGLAAIPDRGTLVRVLSEMDPVPLADNRRRKEMLIFRSYDSMYVNVTGSIGQSNGGASNC